MINLKDFDYNNKVIALGNEDTSQVILTTGHLTYDEFVKKMQNTGYYNLESLDVFKIKHSMGRIEGNCWRWSIGLHIAGTAEPVTTYEL